MRKTYKSPTLGDTRIIKTFAWLPIQIEDYKGFVDWRWLETVTIEQKYVGYAFENDWIDERFVDETPLQP